MMNQPRFYCPEDLVAGQPLRLPEAVARHAIRVLRLREGDPLTLFNGQGGEYPARLMRVARDDAEVLLGEALTVERETALAITLIQAVQAAEKMDWTIQKAVELGVRRIVPATSRRSVVRLAGERADKRLEHWRGVAIAACEQCGRNRLPELAELCEVPQALADAAAGGGWRLMLSPTATQTLTDLDEAGRPTAISLLIGAEGGLDPAEESAALAAGFMPVRLGPRVLRTETAGLAAIAAMQALWGDFTQ